MHRLRLIGAMAVLTATLLYGLVQALASLADGWCGNRELQRLASPEGTRSAVLFERNCGATTGFSSHVSLIGAGEALPNDAGNVFIAQPGEAGRGGQPRHGALARLARLVTAA